MSQGSISGGLRFISPASGTRETVCASTATRPRHMGALLFTAFADAKTADYQSILTVSSSTKEEAGRVYWVLSAVGGIVWAGIFADRAGQGSVK